MTRYVERGGEQAFAPPFLQTGTRLQGFVVRGDAAALQDTVDRYLNDPAGGATSYRVLSAHVLMAYAPIAATRSTEPPDADKGYTPETDVAFWVLVGAGHERGGAWVLDRLAWFLPYVWVDVPTTMATGREVYGYPKELCWLSTDGQGTVFAADTLVLPTFHASTELTRKPILRVARRDGGGGGEIATAWRDAREAIEALVDALELEASETIVPGLKFWEHLLEYLWRREVPMVFFKQFRDVVHPEAACYQAIIESPARVQSVGGAGLLAGRHELVVHDYQSHPICRDLGLGQPEGGSLTVPVQLAFRVDFDFLVELGALIWRA